MAIDPILARGVQPVQNIGPDLGQMLQNGQQMLQVQELKRQLQQQNALRGILSQPGAVDGQGNPTDDTLKKVAGIDPAMGMQLRQNMLVQQQRQLQTDSMKTQAFGQKMDLINENYGPLLEAYEEAMRGGATEQQAREAAQAGLTERNKLMADGGFLTPQEIANLPTQWDPIRMRQFAAGYKGYQDYRKELTQAQEKAKADAREDARLQEEKRRTDLMAGKTEFGSVVQGEVKGDDGTFVPVMAQQEKSTGRWVTADGDRKPLDSSFRIVKPPAPGSTAALRQDMQTDVDSDPDWKNKPIGARRAEAETRMRIAQGAMVSPEARHAMAEEIASYQLQPLSGYALAKPGGPEVMAEVLKINPNYQQGRFTEINRAMTAFGPGKQGDTIRSINTAVQHLGTQEEAAEALRAATGTGDLRPFNLLANRIAKELGVAAPTNFDALKQIVGTELQKAISGGIGAESDREEFKKALDAANSPEQLADVFKSFKLLMGGQARSLKKQYEDATDFTSGPFAFDNKLLPETKKALGFAEGSDAAAPAPPASAPPSASNTDVWKPGDALPASLEPLRSNLQYNPKLNQFRDKTTGKVYQRIGEDAAAKPQTAPAEAKPAPATPPPGAVAVPKAQANDPDGTTYNGGKYVKRDGYIVPLNLAPAGAEPAASPQKRTAPDRPKTVPVGSAWSEARQMWRDPSGRLYDKNGNAFPAP